MKTKFKINYLIIAVFCAFTNVYGSALSMSDEFVHLFEQGHSYRNPDDTVGLFVEMVKEDNCFGELGYLYSFNIMSYKNHEDTVGTL